MDTRPPLRSQSSMGGGGARAGVAGLQRQSSSSSSIDSAQVTYETDEEFAAALSSYDIPQVADALRRYLAFEVQSSLSTATGKQQSAQIKGKFYERFNQILDRVFGNDNASKHKFGGWLDYSVGAGQPVDATSSNADSSNALQKKRSNASLFRDADVDAHLETLSVNGRALVRLLGGGNDDDGSIFQFLFRMAHPVEFKLELDMLPEQSKVAIMTRSPFTSVLFTQLLHKPLAKQLIDLRTPVLLVTIKELYLFYFLRHPASATHQTALSPASNAMNTPTTSPSSLMGSLSESFRPSKAAPTDYSWRLFVADGVASLTRGNPYNILLLQYLRTFLPPTGATAESRFHAKVLQHANVFLHILIEFWLRQNLIVFTDEPLAAAAAATTSADANASALHAATVAANAAAAAIADRAPGALASPFAAVHTYTSYMAPSDDLLSSLLLTLIHLLSDPFYPAALTVSTPAAANACLTTSIAVVRRPLYEFFRLVFSRAPIGLSPTAFLAIADVWLAYIQPWCCRSWAEGAKNNTATSAAASSDDAADNTNAYTPAWATYVLANYHFYTVLLGAFVERAKELDFSGSDDRSLSILDRVLSVFNAELLALLRSASQCLEKSQPFAVPFATNHGSNSRAAKPKAALDMRDELSSAHASILTFHAKALGIECTPVPLHVTFHRDAERLFDKLWSDSGVAAATSSSSSTTSTAAPAEPPAASTYVSAVLRAGGVGGSSSSSASGSDAPTEKYIERVQRLSRSLRCVFEISDAYVASSSRSRSLSSAFSGLVSLDPSRHAQLRHLLTREGVFQMMCGLRQCSPDTATYIGDPMLRPICSFEVPWLVRASYRFSKWLNDQLGLQNPYNGKRFDDNLDVDPSSALALFRFNLRFVAHKANLAFLAAFLVVLYALHLS